MGLIPVAKVSELRSGTAKRITVAGRTIALFNDRGTFHAVDDECPHEEGGMLSGGTVEDGSVWCPLHDARFCLTTGRTLEPPYDEPMGPPVDRGIRVYPVSVIGDTIYLEP